MMRKLLKSKIHRATVTRSDLNYDGSISIDEALVEKAGLVPYEAVQVWNISNGERFETYVIPSARDSGEICVNGAAARLAQPSDLVIISSFCWLDEEEVRLHAPKTVKVDDRNRVTSENH
jgi:aspartate 1-decarboxylase